MRQWPAGRRAILDQRGQRRAFGAAVVGLRERERPRQLGLEQQALDQFAHQRRRRAATGTAPRGATPRSATRARGAGGASPRRRGDVQQSAQFRFRQAGELGQPPAAAAPPAPGAVICAE